MGSTTSLSRLFEITNLKRQIGKLFVFTLPVLALGIVASRHPVLYARSIEAHPQIVPIHPCSFRLCDSMGTPLTGSLSSTVDVAMVPPAHKAHKAVRASAGQYRQTCAFYPMATETVDIGVPTDVFCFDLSREGVPFPNGGEAQLFGSNDCIHFEPVVKVTSPGMQRISGRYRFWRVVYGLDYPTGQAVSNRIPRSN